VKLIQLAREEALQARVAALREALGNVRQRLDTRHYQWIQWLKHGSALRLEGLDAAIAVDDRLLVSLRIGTEAESCKRCRL